MTTAGMEGEMLGVQNTKPLDNTSFTRLSAAWS